MEEFNIIDYLSGLTGFLFTKDVLKRIAYERNVSNVTDISQIDAKTKDLLLADLLLVVYLSPNSSASLTKQHGAFTHTIGSQTINSKEDIYDVIYGIYKKYGDEKISSLPSSSGYLTWLE